MTRVRSSNSSALTVGLAFALSLIGCGSINSGLRVEPGKQFVLGGGQRGAFKVDANNVGDVPVQIALRSEGGANTDLGNLEPGARETLTFPEGSAAVIANTSEDRTARVDIRITGDTNLGMRYESPAQLR